MICPVSCGDTSAFANGFIPVDNWRCGEEDSIFKEGQNSIFIPVSGFLNLQGEEYDAFNYFVTSPKRCYNQSDRKNDVKRHLIRYMNYFVKFYDPDKELLAIYSKIKYMIDFHDEYDWQAFMVDVQMYILSHSILQKVDSMNNDNFNLKLNFKDKNNPALVYNEHHAMLLMKVSLLMNITIPVMSHFMHKRKINNVNEFILGTYNLIFNLFPHVDLQNKLYETVERLVMKSVNSDNILWEMQPIRDTTPTSHIIGSLETLIVNAMPKYEYNQNVINLNHTVIGNCNKFQIQEAYYGYNLVSLSSSKRDENGSSEFDKFEAYLLKNDESLYIQNKVNCEETMERIEHLFGPFDPKEIEFYKERTEGTIYQFQKKLIFNLFYKYFGDVNPIESINYEDYIKLIISAKRILTDSGMIILPYIISSKTTRPVGRKILNKNELAAVKSSEIYNTIQNKYKNDKINLQIQETLATILASEFEIIDYNDSQLDKTTVLIVSHIIREEVLMYISMI